MHVSSSVDTVLLDTKINNFLKLLLSWPNKHKNFKVKFVARASNHAQFVDNFYTGKMQISANLYLLRPFKIHDVEFLIYLDAVKLSES